MVVHDHKTFTQVFLSKKLGEPDFDQILRLVGKNEIL